MKRMWVLGIYEWKKLIRRKIVWISMVIAAVFIVITVGGLMLDFLYESDGDMETRYEAFLKDEAYEKALEGRVIDQELLEETMEAYGRIPETEGAYSQTDEYQTYARPYSAIFQFIRIATGMTVTETRQWTADEQDLYDRRLAALEQAADFYGLSQGEKEFWLEQEKKKSWPVEYRYKEGYTRLINCMYTIGLLTIVVVTICLPGIFVDEHVRRTDQLILSSRHGRRTLFGAKFLAGMIFALTLAISFALLAMLTSFGIYGPEGFGADFRLAEGDFFPPMNVGCAMFVCYGCMVAAVAVTAALVMLLSELLRSSTATLALVMGMVILCIFVNVPDHLRALAQIWSYLPNNFIGVWNIFHPWMIPLFGTFLLSWQAVPVLYLFFAIVFALLAKRAFVGYQVSGR